MISHLMTYSRGLPLGKEKDGIPDHGIRPIVILDSIIRILDELGMDNIPTEGRRNAMGQHQMIGVIRGCEISTVAVDFASDFIGEHDEYGAINVDASNAFSSMDQQLICERVCDELTAFLNVYKLLYVGGIISDYDHKCRINITQELIQRL